MPGINDIRGLFNSTVEELKSEQGKDKRELLLWYVDRYLPIAAGRGFFGDDIRFNHIPTDKTKFPGSNTEKVYVTESSEAFGLFQMANCQDKWLEMCRFKEEQGEGVSIPQKGQEAMRFKGKYTDSKCAQVLYGGTTQEGLALFEQLKEDVAAAIYAPTRTRDSVIP